MSWVFTIWVSSTASAAKPSVTPVCAVGPNAGEVTQGFAVAMRLGATKEDFDLSVGIHPTTAEWFTTMNVTKASGEDAGGDGC